MSYNMTETAEIQLKHLQLRALLLRVERESAALKDRGFDSIDGFFISRDWAAHPDDHPTYSTTLKATRSVGVMELDDNDQTDPPDADEYVSYGAGSPRQ